MSETKPTDDVVDKLEAAAPLEQPLEHGGVHGAHGVDGVREPSVVLDAPGESATGGAQGADGTVDDSLAAAESDASRDEPAAQNLLPQGNPLRMRALATVLAGAVPAFFLMARSSQAWWGVPAGFCFVALAAWGLMDLLGTFDDEGETVGTSSAPNAFGAPVALCVALVAAFLGSLALAQAAVGPWWLGSLTVTASFIGLVAAAFRLGAVVGPFKLDELGQERPLFSRHGFWVLAIGALLYFPAMGIQSLWDPWETHYGEVAREILARDDWVSLWWAQDGWFWSKPILNFWIQAIAMASLGTHYRADSMLTGAAGAWTAHPEWAVRTPNVLMTLGAMYLLYKGVAKVFGRRAGFLGAVVLATMADWFFLAHQTMTDMPFVAAMTGAMGLLLNGLNTEEEARARVYPLRIGKRTFGLSLWHLVFGVILVCAIPQILYLFSRNIELVLSGEGPRGFRVHWDEFKSGSALNCGLPGNEACVMHSPASVPKSVGANPTGLWQSVARYFGGFEPSLQAIAWSAVLGGALYINWGERRSRRLLYIAAWLCAALATMAKGPAGFGLPMICAFAYVATKRRWSELLRLEILTGILVILAVAIPWYAAMYVRHGAPFTDRLIFHDMFNRAFSHVHDTNEGDDTGIRFYLWQLGYALFPWTGLAPLGLIWGFRRSDSALGRMWNAATGSRDEASQAGAGAGTAAGDGGRAVGDASVMLVMWFVFAFFLFTFMGTKFHHYIFPAVPPAAMLIGVVLDDMLGDTTIIRRSRIPAYALGVASGCALAIWGASRAWPGSLLGRVQAVGSSGPEGQLGLACGLCALGLLVVAVCCATLQTIPSDSPTSTEDVAADPVTSRAFSHIDDRSEPAAGVPYRDGIPGSRASESLEGGASGSESTRRRSHEQLMVAGAAILGGLVLILVGRDLVIKPDGADQPGAIRLLQLFTYNYRRTWPESLDFAGILGGFTAVGALLSVGMAVRAWRRHAIVAFFAFAMLWAGWGVDVYMVKTSPHWGQHEVMEAYYKDRKGPDEQLVAYQMNWKGENFYSGNHIPAFVSSGATFQTWLKTQKEQKGAKVMYFITEHSRTGGLRGEVGAKTYKELTDRALCNKFVLVRAEL